MTDLLEPAHVLSMRQQRRDFTANEIARRAIELFSERGFDAVTVDEIAAAAGISARTFFRYFPSKSDVIGHHQRRLFDRLVDTLVARPMSEAPLTALRRAFLATVEMRASDRARVVEVGRLLAGVDAPGAHSPGFEVAPIGELIDELVRRGATHDLDLEASVGALLGAAQAAFRYWTRNDGVDSLVDLMTQAFRHVSTRRTA